MVGERWVAHEALFYAFSLERHVPRPLSESDRSLRRLLGYPREFTSVLQRDGESLDRSGADDPDAAHRLLLRHLLGAASLRGSASQSGLSLVLPAHAGGRYARPLDLFQNRTVAFARAISCVAIGDDRPALPHGGTGRWRGLCGRCRPDPLRTSRQSLFDHICEKGLDSGGHNAFRARQNPGQLSPRVLMPGIRADSATRSRHRHRQSPHSGP